MAQPVPDVSQHDVDRILRRDFPAEARRRIAALLERVAEPLSARVLLAVLKLSDGDVSAVAAHLEAARTDWRDVLAAAEYPEYMRSVPPSGAFDPERRREIIRADWEQYRSWLHREG